MKKLLLPALLSVAIVGCSTTSENEDGYQFGDITRGVATAAVRIAEARKQYCETSTTEEERQALIELILDAEPDYPVHGICSTVGELAVEAVAKKQEAQAIDSMDTASQVQ